MRLAQIAFSFLLVLGLAAVGLSMIENRRARRTWNQTKEELQRAGEKLDVAAFIPPAIPDDENAAMAPIFAPLIQVLREPTPADRTGSESPLLAPLREVDVQAIPPNGRTLARHGSWQTGRTGVADAKALSPPEVLNGLKKFEPQLQAFTEAMQRPRCRFPLRYDKGFAMPVPHIFVLVRFGRNFYERALAELATGDGESALRDTFTLERAANCLRDEPLLISHLVRLTLLDEFIDLIWCGTAEKRWNDSELETIQRELHQIDILSDHVRVIRGERAFFNQFCDQLQERGEDPIGSFMAPAGIEDSRPKPARWISRLLPATALLRQNQATVNRWIEDLFLPVVDPAARRVYPRRQLAADEIVQKTPKTLYNVLAKLAVPVYGTVAIRTAAIDVGFRQAQIACAIERFRLRKGVVPDRLHALVPDFLADEIPDLFVEEPLHYRTHGDKDYIVYSIGWNTIDDGGEVADKAGNKYKRDNERGDWVWFGSTAP